MAELGKTQTLKIERLTSVGAYLKEADGPAGRTDAETSRARTADGAVLLPKKQVPGGAAVGDEVCVFVYLDSSDRPIATVRTPLLTLGEIALLTVRDVTGIGAFLDWGLEKDLLLPFREQTKQVKEGDSVACALYIDKSGRLCATMRIYDFLRPCDCYGADAKVSGVIYDINPKFGAFVAVDLKFHGLIPKNEIHTRLEIGQTVNARVVKRKADGKLDLSLREKAYLQIEADADLVERTIAAMGGELSYTDRAEPERIEADFGMSKAAFKRACGKLLKEGRIAIGERTVTVTSSAGASDPERPGA